MKLSKKTCKRPASLCLHRGPLLPAACLLGVQVPPIIARNLSQHIPRAEQSWPTEVVSQLPGEDAAISPGIWRQTCHQHREAKRTTQTRCWCHLSPSPRRPRKESLCFLCHSLADCPDCLEALLCPAWPCSVGRNSWWGVKCFHTLYFPSWSHWPKEICLC